MAIDVEWQDEQGAKLARYSGPLLDERLVETAPANSCCLKFIAPWEDTTFNAAQVAALEQELLFVLQGGAEREVMEQAKALLEFVRSLPERTHSYLKFIGD
jgi:hypothetical protein